MKPLPTISIIIPVYNVESYIAECLESVMRQTYKGQMECVLVDDCGKDNSIAIAEKLIADYTGTITFRIVRHNHNRGLSAARNTGTEVATGDYVYYLDSDDYIANNCIEVLTTPLQTREYDVIVGDYQMFGNSHSPSLLTEDRKELLGNDEIFTSYANRNIYVMAWNKLCRLSFLRRHNITFLEGQLHEDELWMYKLMLPVQSLLIIHDVTYYYRVRANSIATDQTNAGRKAASYRATVEYIHSHPHPIAGAYFACLTYYWNLYLLLTRKNNLDYFSDYKNLRKSFPLHILECGVLKSVSFNQLKSLWHIALPPRLAYHCLQWRYNTMSRS